jgi:hypothetical protein
MLHYSWGVLRSQRPRCAARPTEREQVQSRVGSASECSVDDWLQCGCVYLHRDVVMNQLHRKYEAPFAAFSHQVPFNATHGTTLDTNPLTCDQPRIRLHLLLQKAGAEKLYFAIRQAERFTAVTDQLANSGGAQNPAALRLVDAHEEVGGKQRQFQSDFLPVLPCPGRFVSRQKCFDA